MQMIPDNFNDAKNGVVKQILEQQEAKADAVSGATYSSRGILGSSRKCTASGKNGLMDFFVDVAGLCLGVDDLLCPYRPYRPESM